MDALDVLGQVGPDHEEQDESHGLTCFTLGIILPVRRGVVALHALVVPDLVVHRLDVALEDKVGGKVLGADVAAGRLLVDACVSRERIEEIISREIHHSSHLTMWMTDLRRSERWRATRRCCWRPSRCQRTRRCARRRRLPAGWSG